MTVTEIYASKWNKISLFLVTLCRSSYSALYKARGRNYMFDIGGDILDAVSIANETRFPNHSVENTNCYARGLCFRPTNLLFFLKYC